MKKSPYDGGADIDSTGRYRYRLWRDLGGVGPTTTFIMLNPSTADGDTDDPTIRRCIGFAKALEASLLMVVNLYAYRATSPRELLAELKRGGDIVGPDNDGFLRGELPAGSPVIAAWGAEQRWMMLRIHQVCSLARSLDVQLKALATTKTGSPRHPLYLRSASSLVDWHMPPLSEDGLVAVGAKAPTASGRRKFEGKCKWCGAAIKSTVRPVPPDAQCRDCWKTQNQQQGEDRWARARTGSDMTAAYRKLLGYGVDGSSTAEQGRDDDER